MASRRKPRYRRKPACSGVDVTSPEIAVLAGPADARLWARLETARGPGDHQHVSPGGSRGLTAHSSLSFPPVAPPWGVSDCVPRCAPRLAGPGLRASSLSPGAASSLFCLPLGPQGRHLVSTLPRAVEEREREGERGGTVNGAERPPCWPPEPRARGASRQRRSTARSRPGRPAPPRLHAQPFRGDLAHRAPFPRRLRAPPAPGHTGRGRAPAGAGGAAGRGRWDRTAAVACGPAACVRQPAAEPAPRSSRTVDSLPVGPGAVTSARDGGWGPFAALVWSSLFATKRSSLEAPGHPSSPGSLFLGAVRRPQLAQAV